MNGDEQAVGPMPPPRVAALVGAKHVATLQKHLAQLRGAYAHGNRKLFYDELATAYLLAFFNPTLRSLRAIEDAGRFDAEGQPVHLRKLCRSTMSDAARVFDARLLVPFEVSGNRSCAIVNTIAHDEG